MKKTFQKELKTATTGKGSEAQQNGDENSSFSNDADPSNINQQDHKVPLECFGASPFITSTPNYQATSSGVSSFPKAAGVNGDISSTLDNIVDMEYLKHVVFKLLTSKEYEVMVTILSYSLVIFPMVFLIL